MSSTNKGVGTYNSKKGFSMNKKDLEESLRRKLSFETCSLFRQEYSK